MNLRLANLAEETFNSKCVSLLQHKMWQEFMRQNVINAPDLCELIEIMISIPPNSGWVERAYSQLEMVCQKRRNRMKVENLRELFFLAVLKLEPKKCLDMLPR